MGCDQCHNSGYYDRIALFEVLIFTDEIKELIVKGKSALEIREEALKGGYRPLVTEAIRRVVDGTTTLSEANHKLLFY